MFVKNKNLIKFIIALLLFILSFILKDNSLIILLIGYIILTFEMIIETPKKIIQGKIFDEEFLMLIATVGAFIIGEYHEAFAVMLFYQLGELLNDKAVDSSRDEIVKLMDLNSETTTVIKDGNELITIPEKVKVGDTIIIKPGEKVPLDGVVIDGESTLDTSKITGESIPRSVNKGDSILSGSINKDGIIKVKVTKKYDDSNIKKIINLIEEADKKKSNTEKFVDKFAGIYTPVVVLLALAIFIIGGVSTGDYSGWGYKSLVFLVTSCPCSLIISIPLTFFSGLGVCSREGILMKNSNTLDQILVSDEIMFDKTGTITEGVFEVVKIESISMKEKELLEIAAKCESASNHPIALSIKEKYGKKVTTEGIKKYSEVSGGITLEYNKDKYILGNYNLLKKNKIKFDRCFETGTIVYISKNGEYLGYILISDKIKKNTKKIINDLRNKTNLDIIMLSGDNEEIVKDVCNKINVKRYMAELLPQDKVKYIKEAKKEHKKTIFVGDGINDTPSLLTADIGISMGGIGSDASIDASDMVIMNDDLSKINTTIDIAMKIKKIVFENISFVLLIKLIVLITTFLGYSNMIMAVFADVGVTLITIINSLRILKRS